MNSKPNRGSGFDCWKGVQIQPLSTSTDDPRPRTITQKVPGSVAQQLYAARAAGAGQAEPERILAEGLREHDFKDNGRRAGGLDVELNDIAWMDLEV